MFITGWVLEECCIGAPFRGEDFSCCVCEKVTSRITRLEMYNACEESIHLDRGGS